MLKLKSKTNIVKIEISNKKMLKLKFKTTKNVEIEIKQHKMLKLVELGGGESVKTR